MRGAQSELNTTVAQSTIDAFKSASIASESATLARPIAMGEGNITVAGKTSSFSYEIQKVADGVAKIITDVKSETERFLAGLAVIAMTPLENLVNFGKRHRALGAALVVGAASAQNAQAIDWGNSGIPLPGQPFIDYATNFPSKLWVYYQHQGDTNNWYVASGILLDGAPRGSGLHFLTAAHTFSPSPGVTNNIVLVGNGPNFVNNYGQYQYVSEVKSIAGWTDATDGSSYGHNGNAGDWVIGTLKAPISGPFLNISQATVGATCSIVGAGNFGPYFQEQNQDGYLRAGVAPISGIGISGVLSTNYIALQGGASPAQYPMISKGAPGDSGGGVFDLNGNLVAGEVAGSGLTTEGVAFYPYRDLIYAAIAPKLNYQVTGSSMTFSWSGTAYALQNAPTVSGPWTTITNATSSYTISTSDPAHTFFRLSLANTENSPNIAVAGENKITADPSVVSNQPASPQLQTNIFPAELPLSVKIDDQELSHFRH